MSKIHVCLVAVVALSGCTTTTPDTLDSTTSQAFSTSGRPSAAAAPAPVEVDVRLSDGRVEPFPRRVDVARGAQVTVEVVADSQTEIHVHGYDLIGTAAPENAARLQFIADKVGVFDVEAHPDTLLLQLAVR
ncbi:hypothetical protein [Mycolicibacterium goodii]|uniref:hypothetical protein n=1 Tax=Mycolicibacterium goodii TaxID=134601 RepID=UPI001BDDA1F6|nr:hypothetical protein [Mycolicibacterium goodii]MBU8829768.1 hypothetical protein [Mycolicibacterium goodii]